MKIKWQLKLGGGGGGGGEGGGGGRLYVWISGPLNIPAPSASVASAHDLAWEHRWRSYLEYNYIF